VFCPPKSKNQKISQHHLRDGNCVENSRSRPFSRVAPFFERWEVEVGAQESLAVEEEYEVRERKGVRRNGRREPGDTA